MGSQFCSSAGDGILFCNRKSVDQGKDVDVFG